VITAHQLLDRSCRVGGTLLLAAAVGCGSSRPARIPAPAIDPAAIADAVAGSGGLEKLAAIAGGRGGMDGNGDGQVSRDELAAWLEEIRESKVAITSVAVQVTHLGRPLEGVEVKLVPDASMGGTIKEAVATTDASGVGSPTIPGGEFPGVNCGLYRVEITGTGNDRKPLPAKYNAASTLSLAVGGMLPENGMSTIALK